MQISRYGKMLLSAGVIVQQLIQLIDDISLFLWTIRLRKCKNGEKRRIAVLFIQALNQKA